MGRLRRRVLRRGFEWFCALRESIVKWDLVVSEVSIRALQIGGGESVWKRGIFSRLDNSQSQRAMKGGRGGCGHWEERGIPGRVHGWARAWLGSESHAVCLVGTELLDGVETPNSWLHHISSKAAGDPGQVSGTLDLFL